MEITKFNVSVETDTWKRFKSKSAIENKSCHNKLLELIQEYADL